MKGRCKTGGCALERTREGFCGTEPRPAGRPGRGPNSEGMCEGLKEDDDAWKRLLIIGAEGFGGKMNPEGRRIGL